MNTKITQIQIRNWLNGEGRRKLQCGSTKVKQKKMQFSKNLFFSVAKKSSTHVFWENSVNTNYGHKGLQIAKNCFDKTTMGAKSYKIVLIFFVKTVDMTVHCSGGKHKGN